MILISKQYFTDFLKAFTKSNSPYYDTITELSWPKDENGETDRERNPLIPDCWFKMLSLDDICKDCTKFDNYNLPSTTDALWYNIKDDGSLVIYFIEFKWHNLNRKKEDSNSCHDGNVEFKLRLKPFESLFIVLPRLFEDYCEKDNKKEFIDDLYDFLETCEIKVYSFVGNFYRKDGGIKAEEDMSEKLRSSKTKSHLKRSRTIGPHGSIGNTIHKQYKRLELSQLIDFADVFPRSCFDAFLKTEGLIEDN